MLVVKTNHLLTEAGKRVNARSSVKFVRDWHPQFIGRSYTKRINHVSPDQVWIQTLTRSFRCETPAQADHPTGSDVAVPPAERAGEAQA